MMRTPAQPAVSESLADEAYRRIEDMIVMRTLPPGSMISESQLSDVMQCGRTPIREALQRLKLEGYIEVHPRRGALVTPVDVRQQLELLEVRRSLEELMVRLAAQRASKADRERLLQLSDEILEASRTLVVARYFVANKEIHRLSAAATRNATLIKTMGVIHGLSRRFWYAYIDDDRLVDAANLHSAVVRAIAAGEPDTAATCAKGLMDFLEGLTRLAVEERL